MSSSTPWLSNSFTTSSVVDSTSLSSSLEDISLTDNDSSLNEPHATAYFASFVTLVSGLEQSLHNEDPLFLDLDIWFNPIRTVIASGASSRVEKVGWNTSNYKGKYKERWGSFVALKYTRHHADATRAATNWRQLLSEVRALLHEPIRYHPNIVRLLGISWGAVDGSQSNFPVLVLELSDMGTLSQLQLNSEERLSFEIKKKLCWDVAKGISILHACGVVHGDLKHENVLVYPNRDPNASVKYVAKISDFGGSVMDLETDDFRSLHTPTQPWLAPEFFSNHRMSEGELKLTDVYALGLLVWRTIMDGENPYHHSGSNAEAMSESQIFELKRSNELLDLAKESILYQEPVLNIDGIEILHYVFENTIQVMPSLRNLVDTIAALQVNKISEMDALLQEGRKKNDEYNGYLANKVQVPGKHGLTLDSLGVYLAISNATTGDYDHQNNGPGFRPTIRPPPRGRFIFDPHRLKIVLDWERQTILLREFEAVALTGKKVTGKSSPSIQITPAIAAFCAFKCYCYEFGTKLSSSKACYWLKVTGCCEQECEEVDLARAWCWRFHITYNVLLDIDQLKLLDWIRWSITNGDRRCILEAEALVQLMTPETDSRSYWEKAFLDSRHILFTHGAGVGMPFFHPLASRRVYHMDNLDQLDRDIMDELTFRGVQSIDDIYVNSRGDGLLHMAAGLGVPDTLKHLVEKYHPNIDKPNSSREETPLISACRGGHLACALYLLDHGAAPEADRHSQERPLWWLSSFKEDEMPIIAARLIQAGASKTFPRHPSFASTRGELRTKYVLLDYENFLLLPASPLSRAVMMDNLPAVRTLLSLGADPLEGLRMVNPATGLSVCPVVVAAVLTLPHILKVMLDHIDAGTAKPERLFSEIEMLEVALDCKATIGDPTSMDRRVVRLGPMYKESLALTLRLLHEREKTFQDEDNETKKNSAATASAVMLSRLASLGRFNILRNLLELGHSAKGYGGVLPIVAAVKENRESIFRLLVEHGADPLALYDLPYQMRKRTLLQVLAERPRTARSGVGIAQALLEKGVPVDFIKPEDSHSDSVPSRPAFSSAVQRQDFELADLCLKHGANVDLAYAPLPNSSKVTVFGELARYPSERNLSSLEYLLALNKTPSLIVNPTTGQTVFHQIMFFWATTDLQRRIIGQMVRTVVAKDVHLAEHAIRPHLEEEVVGIPFNVAISGNLEVFTALLDCVPSLSQHPSLHFEHRGVKLVTFLRAIIANFPQLPEHVATLNNTAGIGFDKSMEKEWMERYKLILYRLEEIQSE